MVLAASKSDADAFLVILGDVLISLPVQDFIDDWLATKQNVGVVVHPSTHPRDSDAVFEAHDGTVRVIPKGTDRRAMPNMSSAGLFAVTRAATELYGEFKDVGSNVLAAAASDADLFPYVSSRYLKDTGTSSRLQPAEQDVAIGVPARRGSTSPRGALFLDRDGVINPRIPEVYRPEDFSLLPGVGQAIGQANRQGIPVVVITNQPGIAKGFMSWEQHEAIRAQMDELLSDSGAFVDDYLFCPHHPDAGFPGELPDLKGECNCRKPASDLGRIAAFRHGLDLTKSVMVGDTERDRGFARALGMTFVCVEDGP